MGTLGYECAISLSLPWRTAASLWSSNELVVTADAALANAFDAAQSRASATNTRFTASAGQRVCFENQKAKTRFRVDGGFAWARGVDHLHPHCP